MIEFYVSGVPAPQGSMKHIGNGVLIETNRKVMREWRSMVAAVAEKHKEVEPWVGAITMSYLFVFEAPNSRPKTQFKKSGWIPHVVKPDLTKLLRCGEDAITESVAAAERKKALKKGKRLTKTASGIIADDSQVWEIGGAKKIEIPNSSWNLQDYPDTGRNPGVYLQIAQTDYEHLAPVNLEELVAA